MLIFVSWLEIFFVFLASLGQLGGLFYLYHTYIKVKDKT